MKNVLLVGLGEWGKVIHRSLKQIKSIKKILIIKSRKSKKNTNLDDIEWVIIAANNQNHFKLVKKYLNLKINVFCEKPLTLKIKDSLKLYKIARRNRCKVYVSDVENYKKIKLSIKQKNEISRSKFSNFKKDIIYRLVYHDFTYLYKYLKSIKNIKIKIIEKGKGFLKFNLEKNGKVFSFSYNLNTRIKVHKFNNKSLISKKNVLKDMLNKVVSKNVDFEKNRKISLFSEKMCLKILKLTKN